VLNVEAMDPVVKETLSDDDDHIAVLAPEMAPNTDEATSHPLAYGQIEEVVVHKVATADYPESQECDLIVPNGLTSLDNDVNTTQVHKIDADDAVDDDNEDEDEEGDDEELFF